MGVYIKGMEMPRNCFGCPLFDDVYTDADGDDDYRCGLGVPLDYYQASGETEKDCPLIELPPHGDLIDASEKIRVQMYDDEHEDFHTVEMTIDDLLSQSWVKAYAYPIIQASESKERPAFLPTYELTPRREEAE